MGHARKNFTDRKRAIIYARDRAVCAFSGQSLWLFDYGVRPNWLMDWADHIKPSAQGGDADVSNGICASSFFNAKKKNNSHDNLYFFKDGAITDHYIEAFGNPPDEIINRLSRLKGLTPTDWYINRAISSVFIAYENRCEKEFLAIERKRDDHYWFGSGWKRLETYLKQKGDQCLLSRGLIQSPMPHGTDQLLRFQFVSSHTEYLQLCEGIYPMFRENAMLWHHYKRSDTSQKQELLDSALNNEQIHPELLTALQRQFCSIAE